MHKVIIIWPRPDRGIDTITDIPNVHTNVPEFNDCQRFLADSLGTSYGGIFAIWAYDSLHRIRNDLMAAAAEHPGKPVAWLAGVVFSWSHSYPDLGIALGFNCLYLYDAAQYKAKVVRQGHNSACKETIPTTTSGSAVTELEVKLPPRTARLTDYTLSARWEWDETSKRHYIGFRCGRSWCQAGRTGFVPASDYDQESPEEIAVYNEENRPLKPLDQRRIYGVPGWYDEQPLAASGATGLVPGPLKGTVFPHWKLAAYPPNHFRARWDTAAFVALTPKAGAAPAAVTAALNAYRGKFGFAQAVIGTHMGPNDPKNLNRVFLCQGTRTQCGIPTSLVCHYPLGEPPVVDADAWWTRIESAGKSSKVTFKCVYKRTHTNEPPPGNARWRWLPTDETVWMPCDAGCCEVIQ